MCGILAFFYDHQKIAPISKQAFQLSLQEMNHRGPDGEGILEGSQGPTHFLLGHKRLAIIDPSPRSNQPMQYDGCALIFNGEIYNFASLKNDLVKNGSHFVTLSDTEVLLQGLRESGVQFCRKIQGIYSFIFVDTQNNTLIIGRDASGVKPLYICESQGTVSFCSELTPLQILNQRYSASHLSTWFYLQAGYPPPGKSMVEGIDKVFPGQIIEFNLGTLKKTREIFLNSDINFLSRSKNPVNPATLRQDIMSVVASELISDVPIGIMLSGGVDSSIIALCAKNIQPNIDTFTASYGEDPQNKYNFDSQNSMQFTSLLGIKNHQVNIDSKSPLFAQDFESFFLSLDEPCANITSFSTFKISEYARNLGIKVLLSGDGADEVFAGYNRYLHALKLHQLRFVLKFLPKYKHYFASNPIRKYLRNYQLFVERDFETLINDIPDALMQLQKYQPHFLWSQISQISSLPDLINYLDFFWWLPEESNARLDKASMKASIEARVPFQSIRLIHQYLPMSIAQKSNSALGPKFPLKNAFNDLPDYILKADKRGWDTPYASWLREELKELFLDYISSRELENISFIHAKHAKFIAEKHIKGEYFRNESRALLTLAIWLKKQDQLKNKYCKLI